MALCQGGRSSELPLVEVWDLLLGPFFKFITFYKMKFIEKILTKPTKLINKIFSIKEPQ